MRGKRKTKFYTLITALFALSFLGANCNLIKQPNTNGSDLPVVKLTYWSVFNNSTEMDEIIQAYQVENPNVQIDYRKLDITEYETQLISALATNRGPDIFSVHSSWLPRYVNKLEPIPASQSPIDEYVPVVKKAAVVDDNLYGLPYSVDTLALYYNTQLLSSAGVANPPSTWKEFADAVQKLSKLDSQKNFIREGAAIGAVNNVNRGIDPLLLLMLQNGTKMNNEARTESTLADTITTTDNQRYNPGLAALNTYMSYSNPTSSHYTWNSRFVSDFHEFSQGRLGIMLNYAYNMERIKELNRKSVIRVAKAPQIDTTSAPLNYASFWIEGVSKQSLQQLEAWKFIVYATGKVGAKIYADATQKPSARYDILEAQKKDLLLAPFAEQAATADVWYQKDAVAEEAVLTDMVNAVLEGRQTSANALQQAETQITRILQEQP